MSWLDYLLLALIGGYCAYLLLKEKRRLLRGLLPVRRLRQEKRKINDPPSSDFGG